MNRKYAIFATFILTILGGSLFFIWQTKQKIERKKSLSSYPSVIIAPENETGEQVGTTEKTSEETRNSPSGQVAVDTTVQPKWRQHYGAQTVEALMASFHEEYGESWMDEKYPPAEWLQLILNRGGSIQHYGDYSGLLNARSLLFHFEKHPEMWKNGHFVGVPAADDWKTYKLAFVDRMIWEHERFREADENFPNNTSVDFSGPGGKNVIVHVPGRVFVKRNINAYGEIYETTFGDDAALTDKQKFDITYKRVHPEGYEIVYLDEDYNTLEEAPPTITREDVLRGWQKYWQTMPLPADGPIEVPASQKVHPLLEETLRQRGWKGYFVREGEGLTEWDEWMPPGAEGDRRIPGPEIPSVIPDVPEPVAPASQLQGDKPSPPNPADFQAELERFEKLFTEDGFETELEKTLVPQLPTEASFEKAFRAHFAPEDFSNERLHGALETLNKYGVQEGIRRLTKTDPDVANHFKTLLNSKEPSD